ncbi:MAG: 3-hydroxyacyl-CoA dehydrogenase family protein [Planctomycetes bacterium]|nr:3-hydroxyacyl-CoA dehydrogenase family protein [Planctomycetota bacterium]
MPIQKIAVVGAGLMGTNIALDFAAAGFEVAVTDARPEALATSRETARANAEALAANRLLREPAAAVLARIRYREQLVEALRAADLVLEAIAENLDLKRGLFAELEQLAPPQAILASNTSSLMPSLLAANLARPERFLVAHYWNPAHLLPLVELVPSPSTSKEVLEAVRELLTRIGKRPVILRKEVPGFIGNRLAFALQREAMALVAHGVATPEEIDAVARLSFGRRVPATGIFQTADLGGLDVYLAICASLFPNLACDIEPLAALRERVAQGKLGLKTGAGWFSYSPEEAAALRAKLNAELLRRAQDDRSA